MSAPSASGGALRRGDAANPIAVDSAHSTDADGRADSNCETPQRVPLSLFSEQTEIESEIGTANAGDHSLIHQLLLAVYQRPTNAEFHASLDEPSYEPTDRLLIKRGGRIVSHVQLLRRVMSFGQVHLPLGEIRWLATLPEYRSSGYATALLTEAESQMRADGAVLATLKTSDPSLFQRSGWVAGGRQPWLQAGTHRLLAHFNEEPTKLLRQRPLTTRIWRHVELHALMRLYQENAGAGYGPLNRGEEYWRWLISRQGFDQIIVAIEGEDNLEFGERGPDIVGYAVLYRDQVVELMARGDFERIAARLLTRACREAIERDNHTLFVHALPGRPLHQSMLAAGAAPCEGPGGHGEVTMFRVLDPADLVARLYPELHQRAKDAGLARPCELQLDVAGAAHRFVLTRRSAKLVSTSPAKPDVVIDEARLALLLLGQLDVAQAIEHGAITVRSKRAAQSLRVLFPRTPLWRPLLDDLQA